MLELMEENIGFYLYMLTNSFLSQELAFHRNAVVYVRRRSPRTEKNVLDFLEI